VSVKNNEFRLHSNNRTHTLSLSLSHTHTHSHTRDISLTIRMRTLMPPADHGQVSDLLWHSEHQRLLRLAK
jgi:hypothetical protein